MNEEQELLRQMVYALTLGQDRRTDNVDLTAAFHVLPPDWLKNAKRVLRWDSLPTMD